LKLLLVILYFYILVYIFTISLISFIIKELAKELFKSSKNSRNNRNLLLLAFYNLILVEVIINNKEI
jgi:hypothetical protein